jgi:hypothetical protein
MVQRKLLTSCMSQIGLLSISFLLGAAVIFFDLPPSSFLRSAFTGGLSWYEQRGKEPLPQEQTLPLAIANIDKPDKTCDGFTLCMYGGNSSAVLLNMKGDVVHKWHVPFSQLWSDPPHLKGPIDDESIYFNDGHIFPNGDLLAVVEGPSTVRNPSNGYGLVKLDKDSKVLWKYAEKCHHDLDVGEDGTIYVIMNEFVKQVPPQLPDIPTPCMVDCVDVLSPEGKRIKRIRLLEAFQDTPYTALFCSLERPRMANPMAQRAWVPPFVDDERSRDVLHTNAVKVLSRELASKFPMFKAGQLLISPRRLDAIAVVDPDSEKVVWAARGPWRAQHDPSFLDNGHLLLFDNWGSPLGSRVLEYDPQTQAFPWSYPGNKGAPFFSKIRGMCQRLRNGNTLIVNYGASEFFEVTPDREVVWSCTSGHSELYRARRYAPEQLPFLGRNTHARP